MTVSQRIVGALSLLLIIVLSSSPTAVAQETVPSIRYLAVESISPSWFMIGPFPGRNASVTEVVYTFALWKVATWGERCYYKLWSEAKIAPILLAGWGIGFSSPSDRPPGLQGIYPEWDTSKIVTVVTYMAEFPYGSEVRTNPLDGTHTYYFYRMHLYFNSTVGFKDTLRFAADYGKQPSYVGSELLVLDMKKDYEFKVKEYMSH